MWSRNSDKAQGARQPVAGFEAFMKEHARAELLVARFGAGGLPIMDSATQAKTSKPGAPKLSSPGKTEIAVARIARNVDGDTEVRRGAWRAAVVTADGSSAMSRSDTAETL